MQPAYASGVKISSPRHLNRMRRLGELVEEAGGATALATKVGTPKTHISALLGGKRGIGDTLAAKLERKCDKPAGWMDQLAEAATGAGATVLVAREEPSTTEWDLLLELREMSAEDRRFIEQEAAARSERWRRMREEVLARYGANGSADPAKVHQALGNVPKLDLSKLKDRPTRPSMSKSLDSRGAHRPPTTKKKEQR